MFLTWFAVKKKKKNSGIESSAGDWTGQVQSLDEKEPAMKAQGKDTESENFNNIKSYYECL